MRYLNYELALSLPLPIPVVLENGQTALITHVEEGSVLFDAYSGNDHTGQYRVPYYGVLLFAGRVIIGMKFATRLDAPTVAGLVMEYGPFDEYEQYLNDTGLEHVAQMRYSKRAGRQIDSKD